MIRHYSSFAKINLFLYVTGKRADGYHDLYSLMTQIDLKDDVYIDFDFPCIQVECRYPGVPEDESNLVYKAAELFFESLPPAGRRKNQGLGIRIEKQIPPGGGLGGGSSNAATVLMALNEYHNNPLSREKLMETGLRLGADVPFFIFGKPAIATGVGERLEKLEKLKPYFLVLCHPGVMASTAQVYKNIDFRLTSKSKYNMSTGLNMPLRGQGFDVLGKVHNDLMESALRLYPGIRETKQAMELLLCREVFMTGSGASLFALFSTRQNAEEGFKKLEKQWHGTQRKLFLSSFN
ncbi:MAG: 4-(cytidine 5'-diphospho)-2-C-methyl-D-erythritol kinase [Proteobacteria bacterium]|nr:4-(cytidine 5'-diphospho)-2-C-methyl-D-erythritol kinase [Pseudomonadota bacterium]MBU1388596.1 4-(cytidine 5'-diphospho)-2-C-methyl-D-erythritol kinase [Pseudomonadota bacterium]MBU1541752.1 4-(cytidine 5'-diphospho)-2-C-methyl-D-erythritol kinase [Pseudomonadota bacterium]MBU2430953.1 4-(cytidine 5'-diphospho)-2-C-methyl-D-erythritol kinase [Pseudomonadota bacterium]MBU2482348.1 4-(cytidine 5'-diphospho)-2-C-methyl-D-erythritol kinase [Pseudomonadota bacterium]